MSTFCDPFYHNVKETMKNFQNTMKVVSESNDTNQVKSLKKRKSFSEIIKNMIISILNSGNNGFVIGGYNDFRFSNRSSNISRTI